VRSGGERKIMREIEGGGRGKKERKKERKRQRERKRERKRNRTAMCDEVALTLRVG